MLSNERFLSKAPEAKIAEEKEKLAKYEQMMEQVTKRLEQLAWSEEYEGFRKQLQELIEERKA